VSIADAVDSSRTLSGQSLSRLTVGSFGLTSDVHKRQVTAPYLRWRASIDGKQQRRNDMRSGRGFRR